MDDPEILNTYEQYGFSRLNDLDGSYWFSGKIASIVGIFNENMLNSRWIYGLFNWFLLSIILWRCISLYLKGNNLFYLYAIALAFPQVWYIFSYTNDDGLPFFLMLLMAELLLDERRNKAYYALLGITIALLLLAKSNYLAFLFFTFLVLAYRLITKKTNRYIWLVPVLVLLIVGVRYGYDYSINGNRYEKMEAMRYVAGDPKFLYEDQFPETFKCAERGVGIWEFQQKYHWLQTSAISFYLVAGKMNLFLPSWNYRIVFSLLGILSIMYLYHYFRDNALTFSREKLIYLAFLLSGICLMLAASFWNSWTFSLQAQGRYLFPVIGMIGITVVKFPATSKWMKIPAYLLLTISAGDYAWLVLTNNL